MKWGQKSFRINLGDLLRGYWGLQVRDDECLSQSSSGGNWENGVGERAIQEVRSLGQDEKLNSGWK